MHIDKKKISLTNLGPIWISVIVFIILAITSPNFLTFSNIKTIIRQGSVLALAAFGQTFVILVAGIDLSVGAVMGLTSCIAAVLMVNGNLPALLAVLIAILVAVLCGFISGVISNYFGLNPFIATYGIWGMALGLALVLTNERVVFGIPESFANLHYAELAGFPVPFILVALIGLGLNYFLKSTTYGTAIYAIGGNPTTAELSGINVKFYKTMIYTFCGFMAGLAGIMFLARCNAAHGQDTIGFEFDSIAAVVAGGTALSGGKGGIPQTLVGVLLIALVRNGMNFLGVNSYLQMVFIGCILLLAYIVENRKSKSISSSS